MRTNILHILFTLSFTVLINTLGVAQDLPKSIEPIPSTERDSVTISIDSLTSLPLNLKETDSVVADTLPSKKKNFLDAVVKYKATDYVSMNQREQKIYLYNEAEVLYQDMEIKSGIIVIDYSKDLVYAGRIKDSAGVYSQAPVFKQGQNIVEPDSIIFNIKNKKALIFNSRTEQSGGYIDSEMTKKENDSVYFLKEGKFTTSDDREDPEFYFRMRKAKVVPGKKVVVGLTNMYIYNVPTPIGLPFAYFPLTSKETSGILFPTFGQENQRGYGLTNGGYYFAISDFFDLAVLGDYWTNGSYGLRLESNYALRYRFNGRLGFRYESIIESERGFPDYSKRTIYNIQWSHAQDSKSNPSSRFSASVNLGSSQYYQESLNQINQSNFLNNTLSSSVSYSKTFDIEPVVNYSVTATHTQNTQTQVINMTLPTFQGSISRIFPFEPETGSKKGIIQNVNFQYNLRAENRIETTDSLFFKKEMFDDALMGIEHSIPITTNFKVFDYFSVSASTNFDENWTFNTVRRYYDNTLDEIVTEELNGFDSFRTYNFSTSLGTTVYGMFDFQGKGKDPKIQAIRHVMRPAVSYNINPSFDEYYDTFEVIDADGTTTQEYTRFENSIFGSPNRNFSSSLGLSLANNFEMKVRPDDSTQTESKKIKLLDNLNFSTSYNFAGDSLQWSPVRASGGTQILDNKMSINFGMTLDPYALDNNNQKINTYNLNNGGSLFRLTSANLNVSYSLSNETFSGGVDKDGLDERQEQSSLDSGGRADDLFGKPQDFSSQRLGDDEESDEEQTPSELYNYSIPWNLRMAYVVNYSNQRRESDISSHSLMFSGDVQVAPRWSVGASSGYDFKNQGFTYTQLRFERDLLSWRMNFNWIPFSAQSSWNFFIGIKSNLLKDIKYDQRRRQDQQL